MTHIRQNLDSFLPRIPDSVKLVVVTKMQPLLDVQEVYATGQRRFGENRVQDLVARQPLLPEDIEWHFIGHLQTNKVKQIAPFIQVIQSVDSLKLLLEINREAARNSRTIDCMLELYIAREETKYGLDLTEARELLSSKEYREAANVRIIGVMGMATFTPDPVEVRKEFRLLKDYFDVLSQEYFRDDHAFREISMGMSGDYHLAIEEGSTMIRIGSAIFSKNE